MSSAPNLNSSDAGRGRYAKLFYAALVPAAETAVATIDANKTAEIKSAVLTNTTGGSINISVSVVPKAGTAGAANRTRSVQALAAGASLTLTEVIDAYLSDGEKISVLPSAVGVSCVISGVISG